jgi:hypothetical protein
MGSTNICAELVAAAQHDQLGIENSQIGNAIARL